MSDQQDTKENLLIDLTRRVEANAGPFDPHAWYDPDMDQLVFQMEDGSYIADRVDDSLTILFHDCEHRAIGFKICGFRKVLAGFLKKHSQQEQLPAIRLFLLLRYLFSDRGYTVETLSQKLGLYYLSANTLAQKYTVLRTSLDRQMSATP